VDLARCVPMNTNKGPTAPIRSLADPPAKIVFANIRPLGLRRSFVPCFLREGISFSCIPVESRGRCTLPHAVPVLWSSGDVAILLLPRDRRLFSDRRRGRPDLLAGRLDRDHRLLGGRAFRNVWSAAAGWRLVSAQDLLQGCPACTTQRGSRPTYKAGSPDPSQSLKRVNRPDRIAAGSRRLPAPLNGALRGRVAGALLGVGDKARPLVDPDRLHGSGERAGCLPEVIMGCRRRGAEGCVVQGLDDGGRRRCVRRAGMQRLLC